MQWSEVRQHYPSQWVLIEAIGAATEGRKRVVDELSVVGSFDEDSKEALRAYLKLHRENKMRELYVVHTSRDALEIEMTAWTGVRSLQ